MGDKSELWRAPARGGGYWARSGGVTITHDPWLTSGRGQPQRAGLTLTGTIASGSGSSKVKLQIVPEDYVLLAKMMMHEDRDATLKAFAQAIIEHRD